MIAIAGSVLASTLRADGLRAMSCRERRSGQCWGWACWCCRSGQASQGVLGSWLSDGTGGQVVVTVVQMVCHLLASVYR